MKENILNKRITELNFSERIKKVLLDNKIVSVKKLVKKTEFKLSSIPGMGQESVAEIILILDENGLKLASDKYKSSNYSLAKNKILSIEERRVRRQLYKKYRLMGIGGRPAALMAGFPLSIAHNAGNALDAKIDWDSLFADAGCDKLSLIELIKDGLSAMRQVILEGKILDYPDYKERREYIKLILQLTRDLTPIEFHKNEFSQVNNFTKIDKIQIPVIIENQEEWENFVVRFNTDKKTIDNVDLPRF